MNKKHELQNNKNVNNNECLLKRMLYCPGNWQELLSGLVVTLVCHASSVFLVLNLSKNIEAKNSILNKKCIPRGTCWNVFQDG